MKLCRKEQDFIRQELKATEEAEQKALQEAPSFKRTAIPIKITIGS